MTEERFEEITDSVIADGDNHGYDPDDTQEKVAQRTGIPLAELQEWHDRCMQIAKEAEPLREELKRYFERNR